MRVRMRQFGFWKKIWRRGFTLVELLTVMVIIGILVGLITVAVIAARARAKVAQAGVDVAGLEQALHQYRDRFGDFPPDCADLPTAPTAVRQMIHAAFVQHFSRAFPRYVISGSGTEQQWSNLRTLLNNQYSIDIYYLDPTSSLTFFLGGLPEIVNRQFTGRLIGFSANPTNPFDTTSSSRIPPFFEFDPSRLVRTSRNWFRYQSTYGSDPQVPPYVYFRAPYYYPSGTQQVVMEWRRINTAGNGETEQFGTTQQSRMAQPSVRPYYNESTPVNTFSAQKFFNPRSFQIICAGADGNYGGLTVQQANDDVPRFPISDIFRTSRGLSVGALSGGYLDNQANFVRGILEDLLK